ncbi:MAG: peptide chain release factor N(5)-glutamine methyltransferase [Thalassolituus sp.]
MSITVGDWLNHARVALIESESPRADSELLLMHVLQVNRAWLYTWPDKPLTAEQVSFLDQLLKRRIQGEPVAYLTGFREFWSLPLEVAPTTLIPRPDTETLIEWVLELDLTAQSRAVDLGTGTGAIALALASEYPTWNIEAVEFNADAAALARRNSGRLSLPVTVHQGSWFAPLSGRFDLIVSNPPYIDPTDHHLDEGDVRFEPRSALVADNLGLADLQHIIDVAPEYLNTGAWLLLEHGYDQAQQVCEYLRQRGFTDVENRVDLGGQPRISGGRWG